MSPLAYSAKPSALRCARCGRFVDWAEARLQVVCECRPHIDLPPVLTRDAEARDRPAVMDLFTRDFGLTKVAGFGEVVSLSDTEAIVAETHRDIGGVLAWKPRPDALQIVALGTDPMWQRSGVGSYLLAEAEVKARELGLPRIVVATSNDNLLALYFYQRHGYRITDIVPDAMAREGAVVAGFGAIPVRDELRLEKRL